MLELIPFAYLLYITFRPIEKDLLKRLYLIKSKADPSIGEELGIESVNQIYDLIQTIEYRPDVFDTVQSPRELLESKKGDCEDFSVLTYSLLQYLGLNPGIAIAYTPGDPEAHAFTYFYCQNCNEYYIFSNRDLFKATSVEEAANILGFTNVIYEKVPESTISKLINSYVKT